MNTRTGIQTRIGAKQSDTTHLAVNVDDKFKANDTHAYGNIRTHSSYIYKDTTNKKDMKQLYTPKD